MFQRGHTLHCYFTPCISNHLYTEEKERKLIFLGCYYCLIFLTFVKTEVLIFLLHLSVYMSLRYFLFCKEKSWFKWKLVFFVLMLVHSGLALNNEQFYKNNFSFASRKWNVKKGVGISYYFFVTKPFRF